MMLMLWKLPRALREVLLVSNTSTAKRAFCSSTINPLNSTSSSGTLTTATTTTTTTTTEKNKATEHKPLRILFCGSDAFSIESLRALHAAHRQDPSFIEAIHVVHRPPKPTGRGLKTLREVPIAAYAASLSLPTHPLNTFTSWTPPFAYTLIIAVSFGLLIPARILSLAPHGGLNLHPSLLPDLRGASPIQHAILRQREFTGVTVQTLHPSRFDAGSVVRQSRHPGVRIGEDETREGLEARLAREGARMLVDVLREGGHLGLGKDEVDGKDEDGNKTEGENRGMGEIEGKDEAPKITKQDHFVDFTCMTLDRVRAGIRALGSVWCILPNGQRLIIHEVIKAADEGVESADEGVEPAHHILFHNDRTGALLFRAACGSLGIIKSSTYPGGKAGKGNEKVKGVLRAVRM